VEGGVEELLFLSLKFVSQEFAQSGLDNFYPMSALNPIVNKCFEKLDVWLQVRTAPSHFIEKEVEEW